jgi:thioredoxin 1
MRYTNGMTAILNSKQLDELLATGKPVIVDFFATWCQPCKAMAPHVDALSDSLAGAAEVVKVDIEEGHEAASKYRVRGVPTFMVFKGGQPVGTKTGAMTKQTFTDWATAQLS